MKIAGKTLSDQAVTRLQDLVTQGFKNAAAGLSSMIDQPLEVSCPEVSCFSLSQINRFIGDPENEAVGIYLRSEGDMGVQMMMVIPIEKALQLVDMLMGEKEGTTQELGSLERSALGEVGNIMGTFFLNAIAAATGMTLMPTPPAIVVDMLAAVVQLIIAATGEEIEETLLLTVSVRCGERDLSVSFWVIPEAHLLDYALKEPVAYG